jgi:hypothetical protein
MPHLPMAQKGVAARTLTEEEQDDGQDDEGAGRHQVVLRGIPTSSRHHANVQDDSARMPGPLHP